jgi:Ca-activated chloride channel family protein
MKQILLLTDGCSNCGMNPVAAAAQAYSDGITVNVIGILDDEHGESEGAREVAEIAAAGGGMSRNVHVRRLSQTMQMMTRQTVAHTIQQVVNRQLQQVFGQPQMEQLAPQKKAAVVQVMDDLQETSGLRIALLVDSSLSMKAKLKTVQEAIADLLLNLRARRGTSEICVFHFPAGSDGQGAGLLLDWTSDLAAVQRLFADVQSRGVTPTGNALLQVLDYVLARRVQPAVNEERGLWSEYVV